MALPPESRCSSSGERSNIFESSIVLRSTLTNSFFNPVFSLRTGILHVYLGKITLATWNMFTPQNITYSTFRKSGKSDTKSFFGFGLGLNFRINSDNNFLLEGIVDTTFDGEETFFPLILTFQHKLGKSPKP